MPSWIQALKLWNEQKNEGKWCVPRKGSAAHAEVIALMGPKAPKPPKEPKARKPRAPRAPKPPKPPKEPKARKPRKPRESRAPPKPFENCPELLRRLGILSVRDFKKWALKNHPDKGGDETLFKEVSNCVDELLK